MSLNNFHKFIVIFLAVIAPIETTVISVGCLIITDFLVGIWAAKKRNEQITSSAMRRTLSKMTIYQVCVLSAFALEHFILGDSIPVVKAVAGVIGSVELKSILENTNQITGLDIYKEVLKRLGSSNDQP